MNAPKEAHMTDIGVEFNFIPSLLGVRGRMVDSDLVLDLHPNPAILHHGIVRASVLAYVVDAVAGIAIDTDPERWSFTTDLTLRMRPDPITATEITTGTHHLLRDGNRSMSSRVELTVGETLVGAGGIGFARVPRRPDDPPKISVAPKDVPARFAELGVLDRPLRDATGIVVVDPSAGHLQMAMIPEVLNPAGTLQGAMVALLVEAAAEELVTATTKQPAFVVDLDLRYLFRTGAGPVESHARLVGAGPWDGIEVTLTDVSTGQITTLAYARAVPVLR